MKNEKKYALTIFNGDLVVYSLDKTVTLGSLPALFPKFLGDFSVHCKKLKCSETPYYYAYARSSNEAYNSPTAVVDPGQIVFGYTWFLGEKFPNPSNPLLEGFTEEDILRIACDFNLIDSTGYIIEHSTNITSVFQQIKEIEAIEEKKNV